MTEQSVRGLTGWEGKEPSMLGAAVQITPEEKGRQPPVEDPTWSFFKCFYDPVK